MTAAFAAPRTARGVGARGAGPAQARGAAARAWLARAWGGRKPWLPAAAVLAATALLGAGGPELFPLVPVAVTLAAASASRGGAVAVVGAGALLDAVGGVFAGGPWSFIGRTALLLVAAGAPHALRAVQGHLSAGRSARVAKREPPTPRRLDGVRPCEEAALGAAAGVAEVAQLALACDTVAAFALDEAEGRLVCVGAAGAGGARLRAAAFSADEGILAAVVKQRRAVRMHAAQGLRGVTYSEADDASPLDRSARGSLVVRSLAAVPLVEEGGRVRGVLVADAADATAFSEADEALLEVAARQILRAEALEERLEAAQRAARAQGCYFDAVGALNRAGTRDEVAAAVLAGARGVAPLDVCALTLVRDEPQSDGAAARRSHTIACAWDASGPGALRVGREFQDNAGLVANVVRYGAALPERSPAAMEGVVVFDALDEPRGLRALRIFPLASGARVLGTLVAGSRTRDELEPGHVRMLESLAIQAGQALHRAQLFDQMERMATTDGLTGLANRRTFEERFDGAFAAARRYGRPLSLLVADVDRFKQVNDAYGHPVGDLVLQAVARTLREAARDTDVVARCGGEEFALLMPETELPGALVIAERIRERIERGVVTTARGPLSVSISIGVAATRGDGVPRDELFAQADRCLYAAKREGRNRVVSRPAPERRQRPRRLEVAARSSAADAPQPD